MLWNLIFEFYVKYIFGGVLQNDIAYLGTLGTLFDAEGNRYNASTNWDLLEMFGFRWSLGNYFSLIATIITLVVILLVIGHFIKKTFNLFGRII